VIRSACPMHWHNSRRGTKPRGTTRARSKRTSSCLARSPEDETTRRQYMKLRAKAGLEPMEAEIPPP